MKHEQLEQLFVDLYGKGEYKKFFAPGRINLIGEHIDYNGGNVFPAALSFGTYALARMRSDNKIQMYSVNFPQTGRITSTLDRLNFSKSDDWANYPKGMVRFMRDAGLQMNQGFDVLYYGDIPNGAGLSSSASIELVTGVLLENLFRQPFERIDLIKIGQRVEREYMGVNSGIMDQFAIGMGRKGQAILLDCETLKHRFTPFDLTHHRIVIMNTNKRRELADSKYNERRQECELALQQLRQQLPLRHLTDLSSEVFEQHAHILEEKLKRRVRHVVTENERTLLAVQALEEKDLVRFGQLINASHRSLRDDYEVTGKELDAIVEAATMTVGVLGTRMVGAGFGGCAIAVVELTSVSDMISEVGRKYTEKTGRHADFYVAELSDGAREIMEHEVRM